ncbi:major pollen allergen Ole e 10-like isoform X2 [Magnolia sinica]|uniref:major pollen allergen Ole e 10-like isoform X2 n=1 Tax=Magnolia sinica TaxID=86752 RepID=UPI00265AE69D|nr:major pollen allergen Ole e 10-like isoform X2 [Magnolia sinica]
MARVKRSFSFIPLAFAFLLCFAACTESRAIGVQKRAGNGTWCIAKPSADETKLQDNIEYSCKQPRVDCRGIGSGGACFMPNNVVSHASVAMNLYYKAVGMHEWDCYFNGTALIVRDDPSIGKCRYT